MPSVCLILKIHEAYRLKHYSFFDIGESPIYSDDADALAHLNTVVQQCYLPATRILLKRIKDYNGDFKLAISLSGVALDLFARFQPELLSQLKHLADTGCVEYLCEPYFHSLAFLFSKPEFREQVALHQQALKNTFGAFPNIFYAHPSTYNNDLASEAEALGFRVILAVSPIPGQSPAKNRVYQPAPCSSSFKLFFENPALADNIRRFLPDSVPSRRPPLTAPQFSHHLTHEPGEVVVLAADLNTFEEHNLGTAGAMEFLDHLPGALLADGRKQFETLSQAAKAYPPCSSISIPGFTSWEEAEQNSREWIGNEMQKDAINGLYLLEQEVKAHPDPSMLLTWRYLQDSSHFLYMNTKPPTDIIQQSSSNPYHSAYDAYINFMNVLTDFSERLAV